jgi:hypothetical protein
MVLPRKSPRNVVLSRQIGTNLHHYNNPDQEIFDRAACGVTGKKNYNNNHIAI